MYVGMLLPVLTLIPQILNHNCEFSIQIPDIKIIFLLSRDIGVRYLYGTEMSFSRFLRLNISTYGPTQQSRKYAPNRDQTITKSL